MSNVILFENQKIRAKLDEIEFTELNKNTKSAYIYETIHFIMVMIIKQGSDRNTIIKLWERLKKNNKGFSAKTYCGVLKLKSHPLDIQKKMRDEWN